MTRGAPPVPPGEAGQPGEIELLRQDVEAYLLGHWERCFPSLGPRGGVSCPVARSHGFSVVLILEARSANGAVTVFAKARRGSRAGEFGGDDPDSQAGRLIRMEHEALSAADAFFAARGRELGVVRPVAFIARRNTIVIEAARGEDLGAMLRRHDSTLPVHLARCGRWLAQFHRDLHGGAHGRWTAAAFRQRLERRAKALAAAAVPARAYERALGRLGRAADALDGLTVQDTTLHGDFKARHIWATPERLEVIDFGNVHDGIGYDDVAAFLVELEVGSLGRVTGDDPRFDAYARVFLSAYDAPLDPRLLGLYRADWMLKKWARRRRRLSSGGGVLARVAGLVPPIGRAVDRLHLDPWFASHIDVHAREAAR